MMLRGDRVVLKGAEGYRIASEGFALLRQHGDLHLFSLDLCSLFLVFYHLSDSCHYPRAFPLSVFVLPQVIISHNVDSI